MFGVALAAAVTTLSAFSSTTTPRDATEVCGRWREDYPERAPPVMLPGPGSCDADEIDPVAIDDALRRTNLFRWLVGLEPVVARPELSAQCEAAAVMQRAEGRLDHDPTLANACYSEAGALASGRSNLATGFATLAAAVNGYIAEETDPSLGHRRWLLYPAFAATGFGLAGDGALAAWSAQWVLSFGPEPDVELVAYPAPGPFPIAALLGPWSLSVAGADFSHATVSVVNLDSGVAMDVTGVYVPPEGFGWNTLAWSVDAAAPGDPYEVRIDDVRATPRSSYVYVTTLVDCR